MSASVGGLEPIRPAARPGGWESITAAATERVQQLQALIAQVEHPAAGSSFASELDSATSAVPTAVAYSSAAPSPTGVSAAGEGSAYTPLVEQAGEGSAYAPPVEQAGEGSAYTPLIEQAAARYGLNPAILHGLIQQESGFNPSARSSAGALGLTQLMPSTAASLGVAEPLDPAQSIEGGARYLSQLLQQFAGNTADALAAYNAGPGAVAQYGGVPPYSETQQYVGKVLGYAAAYSQGGASNPSALAAGATAVAPASGGTSIATPSEAIV